MIELSFLRSMFVVVTLTLDASRAAYQPASHLLRSDPQFNQTLHMLSTNALAGFVFHKKNIPQSGTRKISVLPNIFIMEDGTPARSTTLHDKNGGQDIEFLNILPWHRLYFF